MQKMQLQGILVGGDVRGWRVADFSDGRIAEPYELRLAWKRSGSSTPCRVPECTGNCGGEEVVWSESQPVLVRRFPALGQP
jgi:hypothetical protein